jgi:hypothetical protein
MSMTELMPVLQTLSRADKLRVIQFLAQDLARAEDSSPLEAGKSYPVWSPYDAFDAAVTLAKLLEAEGEKP